MSGCKGKYGGKQYMKLIVDEHGLPKEYTCPKCGFTHLLTRTEKILEIIYGAQWFFGVPEHCEVDEYYIEDEDVDRVINQIVMVVEQTRRR